MAKIVASANAPKGNFRFSLANTEIDKLPYETDLAADVANAETHPWLEVEYDEVEELSEVAGQISLTPEEDALSSLNDKSNDPKAVKDAIEARDDDKKSAPVAIQSGLDQKKVEVTDSGIAETVAASQKENK
jgi:hypothetical protein